MQNGDDILPKQFDGRPASPTVTHKNYKLNRQKVSNIYTPCQI